MIEFRESVADNEWDALVDMYDETGMFLGLGREGELDKIRRACDASYRIVVAWEAGRVIGAARMISDGECYGWIHDVAVRESHRRRGIGGSMIRELMKGNEHLLIGLTSSFGAVHFYSDLGFRRHKTAMAKYPGHSDYLYPPDEDE